MKSKIRNLILVGFAGLLMMYSLSAFAVDGNDPQAKSTPATNTEGINPGVGGDTANSVCVCNTSAAGRYDPPKASQSVNSTLPPAKDGKSTGVDGNGG